MLQGIGTIGGAIAVFGAAWFGATTFARWKQQKLAERRIEQAERILTATYKVRRQLSYVRNPAMWGNELSAAEDKLKENGQWEEAGGDNERRKLTTARAYYTRIFNAKDDRQALDECLPMARALFGEELEQALDKLNRQFWTVQISVDAILRDRGNSDRPFRDKMDRVVWEGYASEDEVNEVDETIREQVRRIEDICVPVLQLESSGKQLKAVAKVAAAAAKVATGI
jgi:membrane-associated HD superfamily phosphohydrolase